MQDLLPIHIVLANPLRPDDPIRTLQLLQHLLRPGPVIVVDDDLAIGVVLGQRDGPARQDGELRHGGWGQGEDVREGSGADQAGGAGED